MKQFLNNLIYYFIESPSLELIKEICKYVHPNKKLIGYYNLTLLHFRQPRDTMKYLLDKGGDPNVRTPSGICPIHMQKEFSTIRLLIDHGAIPNPKDIYDFSPLFWQKDPESTKYLLRYNPIENNIIQGIL